MIEGLQVILYGLVLAVLAALFVFFWDFIKSYFGDDDDDGPGGGELIPVYIRSQ